MEGDRADDAKSLCVLPREGQSDQRKVFLEPSQGQAKIIPVLHSSNVSWDDIYWNSS